MDKTERRRRLLVDKPFQYSLIRILGAVWLCNMVVLGGLIYYLYAGPIFRVDHLEPDIQMLPSWPQQFFFLVTLGALLGLALVTIVGLHMSHQIAGPLVQLKGKRPLPPCSRYVAPEASFVCSPLEAGDEGGKRCGSEGQRGYRK